MIVQIYCIAVIFYQWMHWNNSYYKDIEVFTCRKGYSLKTKSGLYDNDFERRLCVIKTFYIMSQLNPKRFLHNTTVSKFNYHTLPVTPFQNYFVFHWVIRDKFIL